ncbi:MAG TPA: hypothetical protein VN699_17090 [Pirellulales bacterium]|nr:hypothetical protein [Pirellulales bacterium]
MDRSAFVFDAVAINHPDDCAGFASEERSGEFELFVQSASRVGAETPAFPRQGREFHRQRRGGFEEQSLDQDRKDAGVR